MGRPLISIVVPVYNCADYIQQALESLSRQTYDALEIIVIDDGSTDSSLGICEGIASSDGRIKVIHQDNCGVSAARNAGVRLANGGYVGFVDADDIVSPAYVETLYRLIAENNADMSVVSHIRFFAEIPAFDEPASVSFGVYEGPDAVIAMLYGDGLDDAPWGFLVKRDVCLAHSFPEGMQYEDLYAMPALYMAHNRVATSSARLYGYRLRSGSAMGVKQISESRACDYLAAIRHVREQFKRGDAAYDAANARACLEALRLRLLLPSSKCSQHVAETSGRAVDEIVEETYGNVLVDRHCPMSLKLKLFLMNRAPGVVCAIKRVKNRKRGE